MSEDPNRINEHRPDHCASCGSSLRRNLPDEVVSVFERTELPEVAQMVIQPRRLAVRCLSCGTRVVAPVLEAARGSARC